MPENDIETEHSIHKLYVDRLFNVTGLVSAFSFPIHDKRFLYQCWERYDFTQLVFIRSGKGKLLTESGEFPFEPGDILIRKADRASCLVFDTEIFSYSLICFCCDSPELEVLSNGSIKLSNEENTILSLLIDTAARSCHSTVLNNGKVKCYFNESTPPAVLSYIVSSLEEFLCILYCRIRGIDLSGKASRRSTTANTYSKIVENIMLYLRQNISRQITIEELSDCFGVNATTIMKQFKSSVNMGVIEWFNGIKIEEAKRMIIESTMSFTEIAEALGYSSQAYFSKVFKAKTGLSPSDYSKLSPRQIALLNC